jgi:hypothetical protein
VLAAWCYGNAVLDDPALDRIFQTFANDTIGPYWPAERRHIDAGYRDLPFPFDELEPPASSLERGMTLAELTGYMRTWSAVQRYVTAQGRDPVDDVEAALRAAWGDPERARHVRWPLAFRVGRAAGSAGSLAAARERATIGPAAGDPQEPPQSGLR